MSLLPNLDLRFVLFTVMFLTACDKEVPGYPPGTKRADVYKLMGKPSNTDDGSVVVWTYDKKRSGKKWRDVCGKGDDAYIAVFNAEDVSLLPSMSFSATSIDTVMTDEEVVKWASEQEYMKKWGLWHAR